MGIKIYQVDAFTRKPFAGNPAGVCLLSAPREVAWMQDVAREMNLSETGFLVPRDDGYGLRWFTPLVEVDLCGHATLASAHVLWEAGLLAKDKEARFHTKSGLLKARKVREEIELDFPATPPTPSSAPEGLSEALGVVPKSIGKSRFDYLVEVETEEMVRRLKPDYERLKQIEVRGVIVTSMASTQGFDFVSRFFAPGAGVPEDPVTGSAHCCLGPFWMKRLGKQEMMAYQASARGGVVRVRVEGDRVKLSGEAVTFFRGELAEV
jgi:PhzF family phenazine biosynthesis protein